MNHDFPYYLREVNTGQLRVTRQGLERHGKGYALAGADLRQVRTEADAEAAWQLHLRRAVCDFALETKGKCPELDRIFGTLPGWNDV